jgi:hypothetical protein
LKLDPCPLPCTILNSKQIKDLNIRPKTETTAGKKGVYTGTNRYRNNFLNTTQMAQQLRERIDKQDFMKLKSSCTMNKMVTRLKRQPTEWEKNFVS